LELSKPARFQPREVGGETPWRATCMGCAISDLHSSLSSDSLTPKTCNCVATLSPEGRHFHDEFYLFQKLASGHFGAVYSARAVGSMQDVAVKVMDLRPKRACGYEEDLVDIKRQELATLEANMMRRLPSSDNLVAFLDFFLEDGFSYLVMEKAPFSLSRFLDSDKRLPQSFLRPALRDMLEALATLHSANIVHRDVKFDNFVVSSSPSCGAHEAEHCFVVKLCDFGLSRLVPSADAPSLRGVAGTLHYMAPEMLAGELYCCRVDLWALGVLLHMALSGRPPFAPEAQTPGAMSAAIRLGAGAPLGRSLEAVLAGRLLQAKPRRRPGARGLLAIGDLAHEAAHARTPRAAPVKPGHITDIDAHLLARQAIARRLEVVSEASTRTGSASSAPSEPAEELWTSRS